MVKPVEILIKARDEASGILGGLQGKLTSIGLAIAGYFGISAFVGAVKGAADLEAKLSEVKAVSGATAAEMVLLRNAAEDAGRTTKYTATEAADALGNLARAGLSAKDTIAALPAVLQLAQAGGVGLGQASEYITKTVMGMGLAFTDAGRVADVLAQGANASNTSVDGLAQAMSYAAPLAKTLGLSLETTVAIIGKFADAGIDASRAGTALNAIMAQFADPASKFRTELAGAGITTTNFEQALRQLAAAGPAGSKAINAVGTEAGPALRALLNQGIGALDDLKAKLDKSSGSAAELARIMNDNLNGATAGLGSAWDTVKNALATPVLPVLKDGVQQLSAAFTEAVSNGTIAKFGATIATSFENGIKWVKAFAAEVDFGALYARMQSFAASTQETFTKIGEYATNAGNIVRLAYGVMSVGTNAVLTAIYGLGVAIGGIVEGFKTALALLYEGMAKITFGSISEKYRQMAADVRQSAEATNAANRAMADKTVESFKAMGDAAQLARNGWTGLTTAAQTAATQATTAKKEVAALRAEYEAAVKTGNWQLAKEKLLELAEASPAKAQVTALRAEYEAAVKTENWQLATEKMQALAAAAKEAKPAVAGVGAAATEAGNKSKESGDKQQEAAGAAKEKVAALRAEYQAAVDAKNWQLAVEKLQALGGAASTSKASTTDMRKKAEEDAAAIEAAFTRTGIQTKTQLSNAAKVAKQDFELINASGQATADGVQAAFKRYAEAAIAANGGVASTMLKIEASMRGLEVQTDATGKAIVTSMNSATGAVKQLGDQAEGTSKAFQGLNDHFKEFTKNSTDGGSATGMMPLDKIMALRDKVQSGQSINMTQAEYDAAKKQAEQSDLFIRDMGAAASPQAISDNRAMLAALQSSLIHIIDKAGNTATPANTVTDKDKQTRNNASSKAAEVDNPVVNQPPQSAVSSARQSDANQPSPTRQQSVNDLSTPVAHTYTVHLPSMGSSIKVASDADAQALIGLFQRAKLSA